MKNPAPAYKPRVHYTPAELFQFVLDDLRIDAETSEERAARGGPDAAEQAAYAAKCRAQLATMLTTTDKRLDRYGWPTALK